MIIRLPSNYLITMVILLQIVVCSIVPVVSEEGISRADKFKEGLSRGHWDMTLLNPLDSVELVDALFLGVSRIEDPDSKTTKARDTTLLWERNYRSLLAAVETASGDMVKERIYWYAGTGGTLSERRIASHFVEFAQPSTLPEFVLKYIATEQDPVVRIRLIRALKSCKDEKSKTLLTSIIGRSREHGMIRAEALIALTGRECTDKQIEMALDSKDPFLRMGALRVISERGLSKYCGRVVDAGKDAKRPWPECYEAMKTLKTLGECEFIKALSDSLDKEDILAQHILSAPSSKQGVATTDNSKKWGKGSKVLFILDISKSTINEKNGVNAIQEEISSYQYGISAYSSWLKGMNEKALFKVILTGGSKNHMTIDYRMATTKNIINSKEWLVKYKPALAEDINGVLNFSFGINKTMTLPNDMSITPTDIVFICDKSAWNDISFYPTWLTVEAMSLICIFLNTPIHTVTTNASADFPNDYLARLAYGALGQCYTYDKDGPKLVEMFW